MLKKMKKHVCTKDVYETSDFNTFDTIKENRPIDFKRVARLRRSIEKFGLLKNIVVVIRNGLNLIIDGQHLAIAATAANVPIKYVIVRDVKTKKEIIDLITELNSTSRGWKLMDYVHCWSEYGIQDYKQLGKLIVSYGYGVTEMVLITSDVSSQGVASILKKGTYKKTVSDKEIKTIISNLEDIFALLPNESNSFQKSRLVRNYLKYYRSNREYNHKNFLKQVKEKIDCFALLVEDRQFREFFTDLK